VIDNAQTGVATIGFRLLVDASLTWSDAESDCDRTLRAWFDTGGAEATTAYFSYRAALDREEAAARDLERLWRLYEPYAHTIVGASNGIPK
jgi:hypothetical protein